MMADYARDCYLAMAARAGRAPADATKETHPEVRDLFKTCTLACLYSMGVDSFAWATSMERAYARELLEKIHRMYSKFWSWNDGVLAHAMLWNELQTVFGWKLHVVPRTRLRPLNSWIVRHSSPTWLWKDAP
jgi:DNA polymerase-1